MRFFCIICSLFLSLLEVSAQDLDSMNSSKAVKQITSHNIDISRKKLLITFIMEKNIDMSKEDLETLIQYVKKTKMALIRPLVELTYAKVNSDVQMRNRLCSSLQVILGRQIALYKKDKYQRDHISFIMFLLKRWNNLFLPSSSLEHHIPKQVCFSENILKFMQHDKQNALLSKFLYLPPMDDMLKRFVKMGTLKKENVKDVLVVGPNFSSLVTLLNIHKSLQVRYLSFLLSKLNYNISLTTGILQFILYQQLSLPYLLTNDQVKIISELSQSKNVDVKQNAVKIMKLLFHRDELNWEKWRKSLGHDFVFSTYLTEMILDPSINDDIKMKCLRHLLLISEGGGISVPLLKYIQSVASSENLKEYYRSYITKKKSLLDNKTPADVSP